MRLLERLSRLFVVLGAFALASYLAYRFGSGGLWRGFEPAVAVAQPSPKSDYDLTRLEAVNVTLRYIRDRYVEPERVKPDAMLRSALDFIQRDVAQVMVMPVQGGKVTVRADTDAIELGVDGVLGPWDVAAKLREVFAFLQQHLRGTEVDLREVEYAACNGILSTLDPHSVFMTPDAYREMNLSTSGQFGGLGIVISIRDQLLTIMRPMPGTPAGRAGLRRFDRIMKINNESTLNMPLDDAVRRLRGQPGTEVAVWVAREGDDGWPGTRKFGLVREQIEVKSVLAQKLPGHVAYVRLNQFQQSSADEIRRALTEMRAEGPLRGVVLDLRGNPGGLLEQAAKVADLFLRSGVIVATVGAAEGREEKRAAGPGTEPDYPMVVLTNGASASASEIVAGALKNLGRAVIVGQQTFGKGSVQLVFPKVTRDGAALKLTIAHYLTPGDTSIQGVGVVPDIELDPMTVDPLEMDLAIPPSTPGERDLSRHLSSDRATAPSKPAQGVRYYLPRGEREKIRDRGGELEDEFQLDFPTDFARALVQRLPASAGGKPPLGVLVDFIEQVRAAEIGKVSAELALGGIDWSAPPKGAPAAAPARGEFEVVAQTDRPGNQVLAGQPMSLSVRVTNKGSEPVYRLRGKTESDHPYYDERELVFGRIAPGETKVAAAPLGWCEVEGHKPGTVRSKPENAPRVCKIPMDAHSRSDGIKIRFEAAGGQVPAPVEIRPVIVALPRPLFQYSYQVSDNVAGNGDGLVQMGEGISIYLTVKNVGPGRSFETQANLANVSGDGVLLRAGRFDISNMSPGDVRQVAFSFEVQPQLQEPEVVLSLSVGDRDLRELAQEKIKLPIADPVPLTTARGAVETARETLLLPSPSPQREPFGRLGAGAVARLLATAPGFYKIELDPGRFAFVATDGARPSSRPSGKLGFEPIYSHAPPTLDVRADAVATRQDKVKVSVEARDSEKLLDTYLFVGPRKLYYQSNRKGPDPRRAAFEFDAPLQPGVNVITVVARKTPETTTRRTVVVRRDGPDGAILKTPKNDEYLLEPAE
ncbi:MAG: PDZ domain-containing protein [Deltaproteobacteria bacterium]|nr:PDZ domain-containing protein [Deltaproteobacteria bacterium]